MNPPSWTTGYETLEKDNRLRVAGAPATGGGGSQTCLLTTCGIRTEFPGGQAPSLLLGRPPPTGYESTCRDNRLRAHPEGHQVTSPSIGTAGYEPFERLRPATSPQTLGVGRRSREVVGCRVRGPGSRVQGPGSRVQGGGWRVYGVRWRVEGRGSRVEGRGSRVEGGVWRVKGEGRKVYGEGWKVEGGGCIVWRGQAPLPLLGRPPSTGYEPFEIWTAGCENPMPGESRMNTG